MKALIFHPYPPLLTRQSRVGTLLLNLKALGYDVTFIPRNLVVPNEAVAESFEAAGIRLLSGDEIGTVWSFLEAEGASFDLVVLSGCSVAKLLRAAVARLCPSAERIVDLGGDMVADLTDAELKLAATSASILFVGLAHDAQRIERLLPDTPVQMTPTAAAVATPDMFERALKPERFERERPLVLHIHLFKNAGSSVDATLKKMFAERWEAFDHVDASAVIERQELEELLSKRGELDAFSSHQVRPPLPNLPLIPLLFLRDPVARLVSVYEYDRGRGPVNEVAEIAVRHDNVRSYAEEMLEIDNGIVINFHVRFLSGGRTLPPGMVEADSLSWRLERAQAFCSELEYVGSVETFSESCLRYEEIVQRTYPHFSFEVRHENRSTPAGPTPRERLGPELIERLEAANWADFVLLKEHSPASLESWSSAPAAP